MASTGPPLFELLEEGDLGELLERVLGPGRSLEEIRPEKWLQEKLQNCKVFEGE